MAFHFKHLKPRYTYNTFERPGDPSHPLPGSARVFQAQREKTWRTEGKVKSSDATVSLRPRPLPVSLRGAQFFKKPQWGLEIEDLRGCMSHL